MRELTGDRRISHELMSSTIHERWMRHERIYHKWMSHEIVYLYYTPKHKKRIGVATRNGYSIWMCHERISHTRITHELLYYNLLHTKAQNENRSSHTHWIFDMNVSRTDERREVATHIVCLTWMRHELMCNTYTSHELTHTYQSTKGESK